MEIERLKKKHEKQEHQYEIEEEAKEKMERAYYEGSRFEKEDYN